MQAFLFGGPKVNLAPCTDFSRGWCKRWQFVCVCSCINCRALLSAVFTWHSQTTNFQDRPCTHILLQKSHLFTRNQTTDTVTWHFIWLLTAKPTSPPIAANYSCSWCFFRSLFNMYPSFWVWKRLICQNKQQTFVSLPLTRWTFKPIYLFNTS